MRNLKKVLALVVAVAMIASMGLAVSAASYDDVAANASYADAVNLLSNLGIIKGYDDGTFKPNNTVTRAEAATMMVRMLALDDEVEAGDTNFTDVKADDWFSGYVNVAEANGIINGMGDGTFNPNGEVTYGQIVKMIVCALGYEPVANAHGGYLGGGYLYAGSAQVTGFTKGVAGTANGAASRATVARLIYNALEVELMDQESFSTGINGSEFKVQKGETILSEYLELEKVDGIVLDTYLSKDTYDAEADKTITLAITKKYADKTFKLDAGKQWYDTYVVDELDVANLLGYSVVAYVGENEDGSNAIFAIAPKSGKNTVIEVDTTIFGKAGGFTVEKNVPVLKYFKNDTAKQVTTVEIQDTVNNVAGATLPKSINNYVVNGFNVNVANNEPTIKNNLATIETLTLLDNDNDGDVEFIFANYPSNAQEFVVEEIDAEAFYIEGETANGTTDYIDFDYDDTTVLYTIIKDGAIVDFDAIAEGDVVTVLDTTVAVKTIYVSSTKVEGQIDEVVNKTYTIAGKEYKNSTMAGANAVKVSDAGDAGIYYINAFGEIAYIDRVNSISDSDYVYILAVDAPVGDFGDTTYLVKVVTAAGTVEVLEVRSKNVEVMDQNGNLIAVNNETRLTDKEAYNEIKKYGTDKLAKVETTAAGEISAFYMIGNEDFELVADTVKDATYKTTEYNEARNRYKGLTLEKDTLVFHKNSKKFAKDPEDGITTTTLGDLFVDGNTYNFQAYGNLKDKDIFVMVVTDAKASVDAEAPVMVVTDRRTVTSGDDKTSKITGYVAGEEVTVIVDPEYDTALTKGLVEGNVIAFSEEGNYVKDVELILNAKAEAGANPATFTLKAGTDMGTVASDKQVTVHYEAGKLDGAGSASFETAAKNELWLADDCSIVVIDYTYANPVIRTGRTSDLEAKRGTNVMIFYKTVADELDVVNDIVVFVTK